MKIAELTADKCLELFVERAFWWREDFKLFVNN